MEFKEDFLKNLKRDIEKKVEDAANSAFELNKKDEKNFIDNMTDQIMIEQYGKAVVKIENLAELRIALEKIKELGIINNFDEERIQETIAHENAHGNKGEELGGTHESFTIYFIKKGKDDYSKSFVTSNVSFPEDWDEKRRNEVKVQVLKAPNEYNTGRMSDHDKMKLKKIYLKKQKYD